MPAEYGGYSEGNENEYIGMVVATEELSRGSLGIGGAIAGLAILSRTELLLALLGGLFLIVVLSVIVCPVPPQRTS